MKKEQVFNQGSRGKTVVKQLKYLIEKKGILKIIGTLTAIILLTVIMLYDVPVDNSWSAWSLPLSGHIFVIDPGHGGVDGGAHSKSGIQEKDIALNISKYLRDYLNEAGALVIMTRDKDHDLASPDTKGYSRRKAEDLQNRVSLANRSMADFFISIHLNSIPSEKWHGAQTFYYPTREENKMMAKSVQKELINTLANTDRFPLPRNDIMVLKYVEMPSIMVEVGFLSNPKESDLLNREAYQKKVAFAIYQGMLSYYAEEHSKRDKNNN